MRLTQVSRLSIPYHVYYTDVDAWGFPLSDRRGVRRGGSAGSGRRGLREGSAAPGGADVRRRDRKSTRLNSSHAELSRMPSSA